MISNDNFYKTLKASYDADACADAMKEWLEDQAQINQQFLNDVAEISTNDQLEVTDTLEWWTDYLNSRGYSVDTPIQLVDEYYSLGSLVRSAYYTGAGAVISDYGEINTPAGLQAVFPEDDPVTGLARTKSVETDLISQTSTFTAETMEDFYDQVKSNIHSVVSIAGAVAASKMGNVADRLTYYRDYVTRTFSNPFGDISNISSSMTQMLEAVNGPAELLQNLSGYIGITGLADDSQYQNVSNSDAYKYTGANPAGALDFSCANNAFLLTVRVASKAVKAIFDAAVSKVLAFSRKIDSKLYNLTVNPEDIAIRNESAPTYCVDGLHCPSGTPDENFSMGDLPQELTRDDYTGVNFPSTFAIESWFGKLVVTDLQINSFKTMFNKTYPVGSCRASWTPYVINLHEFRSAVMEPTLADGEENYAGGLTFLSRIENFAANGELYFNGSSGNSIANEKFMLGGLLASSVLGSFLLDFDNSASTSSLTWVGFMQLYEILQKLDFHSRNCDLPDLVTNADFFAAATGICKVQGSVGVDEFDLTDGGVYYRSASNSNAWTRLWGYPTYREGVTFIVYNRTQKKAYPTSYPFCPYTTTKVSAPEGKFYIKTDDDNRQAFNKFFTAAVIVSVVAVVTIVAGVTLKAKANKARLKLAGAQRNYENVLGNPNSSPQQISDARKAYKKAKLQSRLLGSASSGLQTTPSSAATILSQQGNDVDSSFTQIKSLIKGV